MDHFLNPRNMGEIKDADAVGKAGNVICGDIMWIYIKVGKPGSKLTVEDVKFKTLGCAAAIATSSILTDLAKGKTFEEILRITKEDVANSLGGLPPVKIHCSLLATDALREALYNYLSKNNLPVPKELEETHKRVKKDIETAEKRYKEFVEMQERM